MTSQQRKQERFNQRNSKVRVLFHKISTKNPKWKIEAVISDVADQVFLAERTVEAIVKHEGIYAEKNV